MSAPDTAPAAIGDYLNTGTGSRAGGLPDRARATHAPPGLAERISPFALRRACATHLLVTGVEPQSRQRTFGHTTIAIIPGYTDRPAVA